MTPEPILIDAIDNVTQKVRYYLKFNICNLGADVEYERGFESALEGVESFLDDFCSKAINTYNEAKATEEDPQWLIGVELDRILENAENGLLRATDVNRIRHLRNELLGDSFKVAGFTVVKDESIPENEAHAINGNQKVIVKNIDMVRETEVRKHARASIDKNKALLELLDDSDSAKNAQAHPDQATFTLTAEEYDKLIELLDAPAKELPELKKLLKNRTILDDASGVDSDTLITPSSGNAPDEAGSSTPCQDTVEGKNGFVHSHPLSPLNREISENSGSRCNSGLVSLITAHPLAEALVKSKNTMVDTTLALFPAYDYLRNPLISQVEGITQTLTQHEALIKQSQAVWAVVEAAKGLKPYLKIMSGGRVVWVNKQANCADIAGKQDEALKIFFEALELMEVKKDA